MSVNDVDIDVFNGVLTDAAKVVVAADVTPGSTVQTSKNIKEQTVRTLEGKQKYISEGYNIYVDPLLISVFVVEVPVDNEDVSVSSDVVHVALAAETVGVSSEVDSTAITYSKNPNTTIECTVICFSKCIIIYLTPGRCAKCRNERVCMSVCLYVCPFAYVKTT